MKKLVKNLILFNRFIQQIKHSYIAGAFKFSGVEAMDEIRQLTYDDETQFLKYINEWYENEEKIVPGNTDLKKYTSFKEMVDHINKSKPREDWVETSTLFYFNDNAIVGAVNIRYQLNESLTRIGGHVGYGVAQSQRGKGYAKDMLGHALNILKTKQIKYVLMTCNPKNFSSQKVIKYYDGYEIEPYIKKNGSPVKRYHIPIN